MEHELVSHFGEILKYGTTGILMVVVYWLIQLWKPTNGMSSECRQILSKLADASYQQAQILKAMEKSLDRIERKVDAR